jgi:hypothetical protein
VLSENGHAWRRWPPIRPAAGADALSFLGSALFLGRIRPAEPPADEGKGAVTAGVRFIARDRIVRASLIGVATINFFNLMFAALFHALRDPRA